MYVYVLAGTKNAMVKEGKGHKCRPPSSPAGPEGAPPSLRDRAPVRVIKQRSVMGVTTRRGDAPRYSYPYANLHSNKPPGLKQGALVGREKRGKGVVMSPVHILVINCEAFLG